MAGEGSSYRWLRRVFEALGVIVVLALLLPALLYVPAVQDALRPWLCERVSEATGLQVSADALRVRFPLDVELGGLLVVDTAGGDTMVQARRVAAEVAVRPLLRGNVEVDRAELLDGRYRLTAEDSSLHLVARVREAVVRGVGVNLQHNELNVADGVLRGGTISLDYLPHKVVPEADSVPPEAWHIRAYQLALEDIDYDMSMLPDVDKLQAHVARAVMRNGKVDTGAHTVGVGSLSVDSAAVDYRHLSADAAQRYADAHPLIPDTLRHLPSDSIPWTVDVDTLRLRGGAVRYVLANHAPVAGLDADYIDLTGLDATLTGVHNRATDVALRIEELRLAERSGLTVTGGSGRVSMTGAGVDVDSLRLTTLMSDLSFSGHVDQSLLDGENGGIVAADVHGHLALQEVVHAMPELRTTLSGIPQTSPLRFDGRLRGNTDRVDIERLTLDLPRYATATVSGTVAHPTDPKRLAGEISVDADFKNIDFVKPTLLDAALQRQVNLPPMALRGKVRLSGDAVSGSGQLTVAGGQLVGEGSFNSRGQRYEVDASFTDFPVHAVLPLSKTGNLTAHIHAAGQGFDFLNPSTAVTADLDLGSVAYNDAVYRDLKASVRLDGGAFSGLVASTNPHCDVRADVSGTMAGGSYTLDATGRVADLDLLRLGVTDAPCSGKADFTLTASADTRTRDYAADLHLSGLDWNYDGIILSADEADVNFMSADTLTRFVMHNEDNLLTFESPQGLDSLATRFGRAATLAADQIARRSLDIDTLKTSLPPFAMRFDMGPDGLVQRLLAAYDTDFRSARLTAANDSNITLDGQVLALSVGQTNIDTLNVRAYEWNKYLKFEGHMGNRRGTWDDMASVDVEGGVRGSTVDFLLTQHDIQRRMGYRLGCNATLTDSAAQLRFFPEEPVVAYHRWNVNSDNYLNYEYATRMLDANLQLQSDSSLVCLRTNRQPGAAVEDIIFDISNLKLEEWTPLLPSLPPITGRLDADVDVTFNGSDIEGTALTKVSDFTYNGWRQGTWALDGRYAIDPSTSSTRVEADLLLDDSRVALVNGTVTDVEKGTPLDLTLTLDRFPLRRVSAFIPGRFVALRGYLGGTLAVGGTSAAPFVSGYIQGDSARIILPRYGASLVLDTARLVVDRNVLSINNYRIFGLNDSIVRLDGRVDLRKIDKPVVTLSAAGKNVQFIGSEQRGFSEVFGKGFADIDATVRTMRDNEMTVRANLTLLTGSNITYVMREGVNTLTGQTDEGMVTFVDFNDLSGGASSLITSLGSTSLSVNVQANLTVEQGAIINAYLTEDGKDRATINGHGSLKYTLDFAGKDNLSGSYIVESGNVRYTPPVISQKSFDIISGSTVTWTGDMFNPQLSLDGTQHTRTSVSNGDGNRLVDFLVTAHVGGSLANLQLKFDMSTENDLTVQNELQTMTEAQRSQAAINLLLYNSYSGTGSVGNIGGLNATSVLFSMLQSQLNSWTQKSLKGVDLSFGINQYESSSGKGTQTSYSYHLSKTLFHDRFKVVVGGEYSTDASASDNFAQNLINDLSFEYSLNTKGSKYVRLFRHQSIPSLLEGEVTETGVGLVLKSKVPTIAHFFRGRSAAERARQDSLAARRQLRQQMRKLREQAEQAAADSLAAAEQAAAAAPSDSAAAPRRDDDTDNPNRP